ncbi:hypothetical protein Val02_62690 [Virgisporangium aliadipatigenens]|uniref:Uncharacterized protein n=1 Tax=Virgisporangium aliadipatigenens TaxID=741659 RepID=A0A8J3YS34_9ACTN|nr:hypothetical protein [Virgisporangium aliadipatigenens]GIJ49383.1 hypothetical protein Val02_62690 [Virgisporangium aliadipatigenens]
MTVTIRLSVDTDLHSLAKVLTIVDLPERPRLSQVRAAAGAVLTRDGLHGALRRYHRTQHELTDADDVRDHETRLAWCRALAAQAFRPPRPRRRPPRPTPLGRPLIDVLDREPFPDRGCHT